MFRKPILIRLLQHPKDLNCGRFTARFCSSEEVGGVGRAAPQSLANSERSADGSAVEWSGRKRGQDTFILFPVFGGAMARQKSGTSRD